MKRNFVIILLMLTVALCVSLSACDLSGLNQWGNVFTIDSAYAEAQSLGYTGSLSEFIQSISGKDGADGKDGIGIQSVAVNSDGKLIVTLSSGKVIDCGSVKGEQGEPGQSGPQGPQGEEGKDGVTPQLKIGEDNYWYVSYDEGTTWTSLGFKASGKDGEQGAIGSQGPAGENGANGVTPKLKIGEDNYWYVSYDNGTTWTSLEVKATGESGSNGEQGATGPQGPAGETGPTGPQGISIVDTTFDENGNMVITYSDGTTQIVAHSWQSLYVLEQATCQSEGKELYYCTDCRLVRVVFTAKTGHTPGDEATDTEPQICTVCKIILVPAGGHEHKHSKTVTAPTCSQKGYTTFTCECGDSYVDDYVDALGHTDGEWVEDNQSTCTEAGSKHQLCSVCGETIRTETIPLANHTPSEAVKENIVEGSCFEQGSYQVVVYCAVCGTELSREDVYSGTTSHDYTESITAPTCTKAGYIEYKCSICGNTETDWIDARGHIAGDWVVKFEATCTKEGSREKSCVVCSELMQQETIPATGHVPQEDDGNCSTEVRCSICLEIVVLAQNHVFDNDNDATCNNNGCGYTREVATCSHQDDDVDGYCDICQADLRIQSTFVFNQYSAGTQYATDEKHVLDEAVTVSVTKGHFTEELRLYSSSTNNSFAIFTVEGHVTLINVKAGHSKDNLIVYGSVDKETWQQVGTIAVTATTYNDYELAFEQSGYFYFKLDVEGTNQIRLQSITISYIPCERPAEEESPVVTPTPTPNPGTGEVVASGQVNIHFMQLGNDNAGDCVYIKAGETDILIDAGSKNSSATTITEYLNKYVTDNKLEYVIVTHAHEDHYAGFWDSDDVTGIFSAYETGTIIDFAQTNHLASAEQYSKYIGARNAEVANGAVRYSAAECFNNANGAQRVYEIAPNITLEILYNKYYFEKDSDGENNHSVCVMINQHNSDGKSNHYMFTGDLEEKAEKEMVNYYISQGSPLPTVTMYKAAHHGSKTSSCVALMEAIKPEYCIVPCVAGTDEYTSVTANQFPTQIFIDNIAPYTDKIFIPSQVADNDVGYADMNGNIVFSCTDGEITISCSNNNTILKDTAWFKENRTCPNVWTTAEIEN